MVVMSSSILEKQFVGRSRMVVPFLTEEGVTDILINGTGSLYVEKRGKLESRSNPFTEREALVDLIERMLIPIGKRVDAARPYVDGRLNDGSRFHLLLNPIATAGPLISIRTFSKQERPTLESFGDPEVVRWIRSQLKERKNILLAGGTGAGKTTLLSSMLDEISVEERIVIIEETQEIRTLHPHTVSLEARGPSAEGVGEVTVRALLKNSLRMRPDRIVVGEVRGEEAFDLLQAMNTGHRGGLGTLHANSALDALRRLESLVILGCYNVPLRVVREWIASNIHGVIFLDRSSGRRGVAEVLSVNGLEGEVYRITPRFRATLGMIGASSACNRG